MKKQLLMSAFWIFLFANAIYGQVEPCDVGYVYVRGSDAHLWASDLGFAFYIVNSKGAFFRWSETGSDTSWDVNCDKHPCRDLLEPVSGGNRPTRPPYAVDNPPISKDGKEKNNSLTQLMKDIAGGKYRYSPKGDQAKECAKSKAAARSVIKSLKN